MLVPINSNCVLTKFKINIFFHVRTNFDTRKPIHFHIQGHFENIDHLRT